MRRRERRVDELPLIAFTFIFITVLLDMLALGVIVPVLPRWSSPFAVATPRVL